MARAGYLCLALALPVLADDTPAPIMITPEERQALVDQFGQMGNMIEKLQREYKTCMLARSA